MDECQVGTGCDLDMNAKLMRNNSYNLGLTYLDSQHRRLLGVLADPDHIFNTSAVM